MSNNGKLTPKLRFPEFRDDWNDAELNDVADIVGERVSLGSLALEDYVSTENILSDFGGITLASNLPSTGSVTRFRTNDVLVSNIRPYLKKVWAAGRDGGASNDVIVIRAKPIIRKDYFAFVLRSESFIAHVMKGAKGVKMPRGDIGLMMEYPVSYPSPAEQQKIADCLSSLDELIAAEGRKWESLRAYKKGLMQQLFPRDGETTPRLRFPEFRKGPGWENQTISSILSKVANPVAVESNEMYREIGIRSHGKGIFHKEPISGNAIGDKRVFWVVQDAFVVNIIFAWEQAVATTSQAEAGMIASHRFPMYVAKEGKCDVKFISRIFQSKKGKYLLGVASPGGAGRNRTLGQKEFEKLEIIVPEKVEEQRKIADCLSSLDSQIAVQSERLDALRAHKKGLMQQLFPSAGGAEA